MWVNLDADTVKEIDSALRELLRIYADTQEFSRRVEVRKAMSKFQAAVIAGASH